MIEDFLETYLKDYTIESEPPDSYHDWVAIFCLAAVLQRKTWLYNGLEQIFPNFFIALVGPSGKCRKGTAMGFGDHLLRRLPKERVVFGSDYSTWQALCGMMVRKIQRTILPMLDEPQYDHCSVSIKAGELKTVIQKSDDYFEPTFCDLYDCGGFSGVFQRETLAGGVVQVNHPWLNMVGGITPGGVRDYFSESALEGGLSARFVFVVEQDRRKKVPAPPDFEVLRPIQDRLAAHLQHLLDEFRGPFTRGKDFDEAYLEWYVKEDRIDLGEIRLSTYVSRRAVILLKLSMIMNASRLGAMVLSADDFHRAHKILRFTEKKMGNAFRFVGKNEQNLLYQLIEGLLEEKGEVRISEMHRRMQREGTAQEIEAALYALRIQKRIEQRGVGADGVLIWKG